MICKKCGSVLAEGELICRGCGQYNEPKERFEVDISSGGSDAVFHSDRRRLFEESCKQHHSRLFGSDEQPKEAYEAPAEKIEQPEKASEPPEIAAERPEEVPELPEEEAAEQPAESAGTTEEANSRPASLKNSEKSRKGTAKRPPAQKKSGHAELCIKLVAVLCAVVICALTAFSHLTGFFSHDATGTIAFTGLSEQQTQEFESLAAAAAGCFYESGYNSESAVFDEILPLIRPQSPLGLYSCLFEPEQPSAADPLGRYEGGCVAVDYEKIERLCSLFGVSPLHDCSTRTVYCDGENYYFAPDSSLEARPELTVTSSSGTTDGKYYIQAAVSQGGSQSEVYFIAEAPDDGEKDGWKIERISAEPIYSSIGTEISSEQGGGVKYEMTEQTVESKTSSGVSLAVYTLEYPVFTDESETAASLNLIYSQLAESYLQQAENADELYESFIESGGSQEDLPLFTNVVSSVTYNKNGYLSILERTTGNNPFTDFSDASQTTAQSYYQSEGQLELSAFTRFESYTVETQTGAFVQKDSVLGKDYQAMQQTLLQLYLEQTGSSSEQSPTDEEYVPTEQEQQLAQLIYQGAWVLSDEGVRLFFYLQGQYSDSLTVPYRLLSFDPELSGQISNQ